MFRRNNSYPEKLWWGFYVKKGAIGGLAGLVIGSALGIFEIKDLLDMMNAQERRCSLINFINIIVIKTIA